MANFNRAVLSLSGGVDSTTLLAHYLHDGIEVTPVFFKYPSQHNPYEMQAAVNVAHHYKQTLRMIDVTEVFKYTESGLISGSIARGAYNEQGMATTVVPGRNLIFASILASIAQTLGRCRVGLGIHQGDHALYPDCREDWAVAVGHVFDLQSEFNVVLDAPFSAMSKREIVAHGKALGVPYHLTRSCYSSNGDPCHDCGTCIERDDAFEVNGYTLEGFLK